MNAPNFKSLYEFKITLDREVEEENVRVEGDKTISEKVKVKRQVEIPIALKRPSRAEREEAAAYRAEWWSKYVERGILPQALLLRTYADKDGILDKEQRKIWDELQVKLFAAERALRETEILKKDDKAALEKGRLDFVTARQDCLDFQQQQAIFFENTAEAKARLKVIEWLVVNLSYRKEQEEWQPVFTGKTLEDKLNHHDELLESGDELVNKAYEMLVFWATAYASGAGDIAQDDISAFLGVIN